MSMTQPMTTLTCGQCAPLLLRSSPVPRSTFAHCARLRHVFLRYGLRRARADYFANKSVTVITPDKWTKGFKTDAAGRIDVPVSGKGRYVLVSSHEVPATGDVVIAGQKVAKLGYTTTLTFVAQ